MLSKKLRRITILLISPSTIEDFGMTERREDKDRLSTYRQNHPKKDFVF